MIRLPHMRSNPDACGATIKSRPTSHHHRQEPQPVFGRRQIEEGMAGFGSGFTAVFVGFPLDVIKTRIQTSTAVSSTTSSSQLPSVLSTAQSIVRTEGFFGLYKGLASPLFTLSVAGSVSFVSYQTFRELYQSQSGWHYGNMLAGFSCGPITGIISTMENHIRTQMQLDNINKQRFRNSFHCLRKILFRYGGIPTLFTGWGITTLKDCAYFSAYFFVYEGVKESMDMNNRIGGGGCAASTTPASSYVATAAIPVAGGAAGMAAWFFAYPFDVVRAVRHGQSLERTTTTTTTPNIKGSSWQIFQHLCAERGIRGFFRGVTPTLFRASMVHSVRFSVYEGILWLFRHYNSDDDDGIIN